MSSTISVLHERARQHHWEGVGALSIKLFPVGGALYRSGAAVYAVDPQRYLLLNHGQPYTITIDALAPVTSFCLFFPAGFAEDVQRSCTASADELLVNPVVAHHPTVEFYERTYRHDPIVSPALLALYRAYPMHIGDQGWLTERAHDLMARLLQVHQRICAEVDALPALRAATRDELYRRLHHAREYADAMLDQPITLDDMAHIAALSPNHFLRSFRHVFHQTPHQYLIVQRIERAKRLLAQTDQPITAICFDVGFHSLGSFSTLFRQRVGCSPSAYREKGDF